MKRRVVIGLVFSVGCCVPSLHAAESRVRTAALGVYIHGMTAAIAEREVGRDGIAELLQLVDDPSFPRRDNIVAFLAYLGGAESTPALVRVLDRPMVSGASIEDQRALLLVPHALGRIAGRGDPGALEALLSITAQNAVAGEPARHAGVREAAIAGLALTGKPAARRRLAAIAGGRIVPDPQHPELAERARSALDTISAPSPGPRAEDGAAVTAVDYVPDPAQQAHLHGLTFANHASVSSPMTAPRLDDVLQEGTRRVATGNFDGDVPCCTVVSRSGVAGSFGNASDGLDAINDNAALTTVLNNSAGRAKVVNVINFCGGSSGTNIIGCSYLPGRGMVLVRLSSLGYESVLWVHEYGHNLGLGHSPDDRAIMYGSDDGTNNGIALVGCSAFHNPPAQTIAIKSVAGTCSDDGDTLADPIDNCPVVANESQADTDGNGVGDACEGGVVPADIDLSGRVDGFDLARLGRAFGTAVGDPGYDAAADLNQDGQVDGADLALLASAFGT